MKRLFAFAAAFALLCAGPAVAGNDGVDVIPLPVSVVRTAPGNLDLPAAGIPVYISGSLDVSYVETVLREMGFDPVFTPQPKRAAIAFVLDKKQAGGKPGAYTLEIGGKKGGAKAAAPSSEGLLNALQTLRQLAGGQGGTVTLPRCTITDAPAFAWRAFMLDESRHFHGMQTVRNLLDEMARLKMNVFHWHLTDDPGWRIEIKKYPLLTATGSKRDYSNYDLTPEQWDALGRERAYYTQDEIREIVRYAAARGISVVPEIEVPGHASAAVYAYPWLGTSSSREGTFVNGDLYNVVDPQVETFLHEVLDEVIALFPSKIVHIGGDEAAYWHWENDPRVQAFMKANDLPTCSDLQVWAINRLSGYLASKGCRMIGWNEITGDNIRGEAHVQASRSEKLAPGTLVQFWDGDISLVNKAIEKGYDVVNANRHFTYLDYPYEAIPFEKAYSFDPVPGGLAPQDENKILGLGCQMWGERTPTVERVNYQTFPRLAAYAECGWTPAARKDYAGFLGRFEKIAAIWREKGYLKDQPVR